MQPQVLSHNGVQNIITKLLWGSLCKMWEKYRNISRKCFYQYLNICAYVWVLLERMIYNQRNTTGTSKSYLCQDQGPFHRVSSRLHFLQLHPTWTWNRQHSLQWPCAFCAGGEKRSRLYQLLVYTVFLVKNEQYTLNRNISKKIPGQVNRHQAVFTRANKSAQYAGSDNSKFIILEI